MEDDIRSYKMNNISSLWLEEGISVNNILVIFHIYSREYQSKLETEMTGRGYDIPPSRESIRVHMRHVQGRHNVSL